METDDTEVREELAEREVREPRSRLLEGMAHAVARKGYGETIIADIVGQAGVSRRTFYEHFNSKAECLIALYEAASHNALRVLREAIDPSHEWQTQIDDALTGYLGCMAANPVLLRTLFIEILHLGPEGMAARRRVNQEIANFIQGVVNTSVPAGAPPALTPTMAMALVGGINELVLEYIEQDKVAKLEQLVAPASQLVRALTHSHTNTAT